MLSCTKCWAVLPSYAVRDGGVAGCPSCGSVLELYLFPALVEVRQALTREQLELTAGAAHCFHHASKRADSICSQCGKFLCGLCSLEIGDSVWCAQCLSTGAAKNGVQAVEGRRTLWDSIALGTALLPLVVVFLIYFWIFTAPAAIFLSLKYWKRPTSILPRTKVRFVLAILIGLLQLGAWILLLVAVIIAVRQRPS